MSEVPIASAAACAASPAELACRIGNGDAEAEHELMARLAGSVKQTLLRRVRGRADAEDLSQEALRIGLLALRQGRLRSPEHVVAYLRGIACNLTRRARRQACGRRQRPLDERDVVSSPGATPEAALWACERRRLIGRVLLELSWRDRIVLTGLYLCDLRKAEMCCLLHVGANQFDVIKFRALARFRKRWLESACSPRGCRDCAAHCALASGRPRNRRGT